MTARRWGVGFVSRILVSTLILRLTKSSADGFSTPPILCSARRQQGLLAFQRLPVPLIPNRLSQPRSIAVRGGHLQSSVVDRLWIRHPFLAAALVCAIKAAAADLVAQRRQRSMEFKTGRIDGRRTLAFVLYGALYQGVAQEFIYNNLYSRLFGDSPTLTVIATKVAFDAVFHNALVCVPMAYIVKACVFRYSIKEGLRRYMDDVAHHGLLLKYYSIWIPVNFCVYAFIPKHWRITTMAVVSFFWMTILSTIASRKR